MALNNVTIMGRLVRDPELKRTTSGTAVTSFILAVDRDFKTDGQPDTDFIDVVAWRGTAEFICKHFTRGKMMIVVGNLQMRDWTNKEGEKRRNAEVQAKSIYFGDSKKETAGNYNAPQFAEIEEDEDTLPF